MKISRSVAYAVQATLLLAQSKSTGPVPCSQLAAEGHMPERFLLQVLRHLVTHGILHSTRGVEGGYALDRKPDEISLLDVIEAIEGPVAVNWPMPEATLSAASHKKVRDALREITSSSRQQLDSIKISDLLKDSSHVHTA